MLENAMDHEVLVGIDLWQKSCKDHFTTKIIPTLHPALAQ